MTLVFKRFFFNGIFIILTALGLGHIGVAYAVGTCSPGIPCTSYDITTTPNAGTSLNGWKTGEPPPFTGGSCDGNYMNQIYSEAYMQSEREIVMNEQIIRKPDSVLEYTCFDQYMGKTGVRAGPIFSESHDWVNRSIDLKTNDETHQLPFSLREPGGPIIGVTNGHFNDDHLDKALHNLLTNTLKNYVTKNFSHTYLGGASGIDNNLNYGVFNDNYNCGHMKAIWQLSKCTNFGEDDKFLSFGQLVSGDPRQLPAACNGTPVPTINTGAPPETIPLAATWISTLDALGIMTITESDPCPAAGITGLTPKDQIRLSNNCDFNFSAFEVAKSYFEYTRDPRYAIDHPEALLSYIPVPLAFWGGLNVCGPPIPTGIKMPGYFLIKTTDLLSGMDTTVNAFSFNVPLLGNLPGVEYTEHVCPNPSCSFIPGINICVPMFAP